MSFSRDLMEYPLAAPTAEFRIRVAALLDERGWEVAAMALRQFSYDMRKLAAAVERSALSGEGVEPPEGMTLLDLHQAAAWAAGALAEAEAHD